VPETDLLTPVRSIGHRRLLAAIVTRCNASTLGASRRRSRTSVRKRLNRRGFA
jgi:hypothetical protein